jgi:hypothetical protein
MMSLVGACWSVDVSKMSQCLSYENVSFGSTGWKLPSKYIFPMIWQKPERMPGSRSFMCGLERIGFEWWNLVYSTHSMERTDWTDKGHPSNASHLYFFTD